MGYVLLKCTREDLRQLQAYTPPCTDDELAAAVTVALQRHGGKGLQEVRVEVDRGMGTLHGTTPTVADKARAEQIARATPGVIAVKNELLASTTLTARVAAALADDPHTGSAVIGGLHVAPVMNIPKFECFFRVAAGLDIDKNDLKRYSDFVNQKIYDLLLRGQATAKANGCDIIEPFDLPITKGLQERMHDFRDINEEIELKPILEHIATQPQLDLTYSVETEAELPSIVGGLSVALARTFKIIDPDLKNPQTMQWERVFSIFNLLP